VQGKPEGVGILAAAQVYRGPGSSSEVCKDYVGAEWVKAKIPVRGAGVRLYLEPKRINTRTGRVALVRAHRVEQGNLYRSPDWRTRNAEPGASRSLWN